MLISLVAGLAVIFLLAGTGRAESPYRYLFCTLQGNGHGIYTVRLRVPSTHSGRCEVEWPLPTIISGPQPYNYPPPLPTRPPGTSMLPPTPPSWTSSMNIMTTTPRSSQPPDSGVAPISPDAARLAGMKLKEIGPLTTTTGAVYPWCHLVTFQKDAVIVVDGDGVFEILLSDLAPSSRQVIEGLR